MPMMGSLVVEQSKLYARFQQLHIETGKLGNNEFSAWQDSYNKKKCKFLDWFQTYITTDNCLTYSEKLDYNELVATKLLLKGTEYEIALKRFESEHPGIFDWESHENACSALESECKYYAEELEYLNKELEYVTDQHSKLKRRQIYVNHEVDDAEFERDEVAAKCLQYAEAADELNVHLGKQLGICCNIFSEYNEQVETTFLCNTYMKQQAYCLLANLEELLNRFTGELQENSDFCVSFGSVSNHGDNNDKSLIRLLVNGDKVECSFYNNPYYDKAAEVMTERLITVFRMHHHYLQEVEICHAKVKYLKQLNKIHDLPNRQRDIHLLIYSLNFSSKELDFKQKLNEWESLIVRYVDKLIKEASTGYTALEQAAINSEIKCCEQFNAILDGLIEHGNITLELVQCEIQSFDDIATFMNDMQEYVTDLQQCEARIEWMKLKNAEYDAYLLKPLEDKWHLLRGILNIINVQDNLPLSKALEAIKAFEDECEALEKTIFIDDVDLVANELTKIEENNKLLVTFLGNPATDELHVIPSIVNDTLLQFVDSVVQEDKELRYAQSVLSKTKQQAKNSCKWLKMKSQLWMYFLKKPEKLEQIIEDIQRFVESKRAAFLNS